MNRSLPAVLLVCVLSLLPLSAVVDVASAKPDPNSRVLAAPTIGQPGARVVVVGRSGGGIHIPYYRLAGWWKGSRPLMATKGSSVIVGHVSDDSDRPGVFYRLRAMRKGDTFQWRMGKNWRTFQVVRIQITPKGRLPQRIFDRDGKRRVHLVSCTDKETYSDGSFHYRNNLTVTAKPVD